MILKMRMKILMAMRLKMRMTRRSFNPDYIIIFCEDN